MYKIVVFGVGNAYKKISCGIDYSNVEIIAFTDNNSERWNHEFESKKIIPPSRLKEFSFDYILIASSYYDEISIQLMQLDIEEKKIIPYYDKNYLENCDFQCLTNVFKHSNIVDIKLQCLRDIEKQNLKFSEANMFLNAKLNIDRINKLTNINNISDTEFKVFSQWGEDGIIQYLINKIPIEHKIFVEFGVENYTEANTRFLLMNNNWKGLIIDGSKKNIDYVKSDDRYWKHDLQAVCSFITRENINDLIRNANIEGDIGLLSIDIDGNDYWVFENIDVIKPRIIICEYNSIFGAEQEVSVPYKQDFYRTKEHYSNLYFGASILSLCKLADKKGYYFIGSTSAGNDAFFVRKDLCENLKDVSPREGYVESRFRESRNENGELSFISGKSRLKLIENMELYDFRSLKNVKIKDLYNL